MSQPIDYRLYLVTDRGLLGQQSLVSAVEQGLAGGVTMVQLREKDLDARSFLSEARQLKELTQKYHVPLIINDRVDIALACEADGVHVGQSDLPVAVVRQLMGPDKIIGASAQTLAQALAAEKDGADYLGVGALFPTATKSDAVPVSLSELAEICRQVSIPIVLIGGINAATIPTFKQQAVAGFALVSALLASSDITQTSQQLLAKIDQTLAT